MYSAGKNGQHFWELCENYATWLLVVSWLCKCAVSIPIRAETAWFWIRVQRILQTLNWLFFEFVQESGSHFKMLLGIKIPWVDTEWIQNGWNLDSRIHFQNVSSGRWEFIKPVPEWRKCIVVWCILEQWTGFQNPSFISECTHESILHLLWMHYSAKVGFSNCISEG
jgi:hypothetical protein